MVMLHRWSVSAASPRARVPAVIIAAWAIAVGGTSFAGQLQPSASVTTLTPDWKQKFTIDWTVEAEAAAGGQRIRGYVVSQYGRSVSPLRVLGQALDTSGAVVGQRMVWVPGGVRAFGRSYFEVPRLPSANQYLVTVWDYSALREP